VIFEILAAVAGKFSLLEMQYINHLSALFAFNKFLPLKIEESKFIRLS